MVYVLTINDCGFFDSCARVGVCNLGNIFSISICRCLDFRIILNNTPFCSKCSLLRIIEIFNISIPHMRIGVWRALQAETLYIVETNGEASPNVRFRLYLRRESKIYAI